MLLGAYTARRVLLVSAAHGEFTRQLETGMGGRSCAGGVPAVDYVSFVDTEKRDSGEVGTLI